MSRYRAEGWGEEEGGEGSCVCLSRSLSEQNADRKCSCRNDSLHRRQTPTASPFPLPFAARSLSQRRFRRRSAPLPPCAAEPRLGAGAACSVRGLLRAPRPPSPALRGSSFPFSFPADVRYEPGVCTQACAEKGRHPAICEEGAVEKKKKKKKTCFWVRFSLRMVGGTASDRKMSPRRRQA